MTYQELIAKALNGRSVNEAAQEWGVPQTTLNTYARGRRMPDYQTALIIAREAGVDPGTVMKICAAEEALKKPRGMFAEMGYAAAAILASVILFLTPTPSEAAPVLKGNSGSISIMLNYINRPAT
jgi:transcriptional regulator with XRE-family HTH domain